MPCLGIVLLEAGRGEEDEAGQMGGFALHGARDSIDQQRRPSEAVPHGPQPIGLLLCPAALLMTSVTASATTALAVMLSTHPAALMSATEALCTTTCTCVWTETPLRFPATQCLCLDANMIRCTPDVYACCAMHNHLMQLVRAMPASSEKGIYLSCSAATRSPS